MEPEYLFHDSCQPKAPSHVPGPPIHAPPPRPLPPAPVVHHPPPPPPHAAGALSDAACQPTTTNAQAAPGLPGSVANIHPSTGGGCPPSPPPPANHMRTALAPVYQGPAFPPFPPPPPVAPSSPPVQVATASSRRRLRFFNLVDPEQSDRAC